MARTGRPPAGNGERAGVQSVEVGFAVLRPLVDAGRSLPLKAIADGSGIAPAKVHRYLMSLIRAGLVEQEPTSGQYGLGAFALEVGLAALGQLDRDALGRQAIRELRDTLKMSACYCVWSASGATVIAVEAGHDEIFVGLRTGSRLASLRSATGHVFLAYLADAELDAHFARERIDRRRMAADIAAIRTRVRKAGFGAVRDVVMRGMSGLAAPVFDHSGQIAAALTLVCPTGTFDKRSEERAAVVLKERAARLSMRIGWRAGAT